MCYVVGTEFINIDIYPAYNIYKIFLEYISNNLSFNQSDSYTIIVGWLYHYFKTDIC